MVGAVDELWPIPSLPPASSRHPGHPSELGECHAICPRHALSVKWFLMRILLFLQSLEVMYLTVVNLYVLLRLSSREARCGHSLWILPPSLWGTSVLTIPSGAAERRAAETGYGQVSLRASIYACLRSGPLRR